MAVISILGTLAGLAIPTYWNYIEEAKITKSIAEISMLQKEIYAYKEKNECLPATLADIGRDTLPDPWGNPYDYLNFDILGGKGKGKKGKGNDKPRKDHHLHPINTDFDLCSMGRDGKTNEPLTAEASRDDIIRASNGTYIGLASEY
jgi:general secretion pathway protein G